jgi:hypothetical protein
VDRHIGAALETKIRVMYEEWIEGWEAAGEPKLSAGDRQLLLAQWVSVAWESLKRDEYLIRQSFVQTGLLVARTVRRIT